MIWFSSSFAYHAIGKLIYSIFNEAKTEIQKEDKDYENR